MPSITIRNVPEETRNELAARAAGSGRSLQEYLRGELINMASKPDRATWVKQVEERVKRDGIHVSAETILAWRDADRR